MMLDWPSFLFGFAAAVLTIGITGLTLVILLDYIVEVRR